MKKRRNVINHLRLSIMMAVFPLLFFSCTSGTEEKNQTTAAKTETPNEDTGTVGPVKSVNLGESINDELAENGRNIFENKCSACHQFEERYVGPALGGVTERRGPVWIMNMIIAPEEMTQKDPVARQLLAEYMTQMVNQNISEDDARALLEYFRSNDNKNTNP